MRTRKWLSLICGIALVLPVVACSRMDPSKTTQHTETCEVEIVYKRNQICYAISNQEENHSLYTFNAAGLPVMEQDGKKGTASSLKPGMCVSVTYDGYLLETYPAQFSGVTEVKVDQVKANNVDFFTKQISSMFPSTSPSDLKHWNISFQGVPVLRENEKLALKHILSENWNNTSITIDSSESDPEETAQILIRIDEYTTSTMTFEITVNAGNEESPTSRDFNVTLSDGTWNMN